MIVCIPKVPGARTMGDYRPIALANIKFKIVTKIVADRLAGMTSQIISIEQRGFVRGRNISECIVLASEAINSLDKRQYGGNIALKVDISKAFDTLDWNFLTMVMHNFGFSNIFINWILAIIQLARLSILVNGKAVGFFSCSRGVHQGDPLSPLLFCLAEEVLIRALSTSAARGQLIPTYFCRGTVFPTHVLYVDDIMIFCTGLKSNIRELLSIFKGKSKVIHFRMITDRIKNKLTTWKGRILSIMGRVQLVKSVIHGMMVYSFHVYCNTLNSIL